MRSGLLFSAMMTTIFRQQQEEEDALAEPVKAKVSIL
jgi:hypothetical protein